MAGQFFLNTWTSFLMSACRYIYILDPGFTEQERRAEISTADLRLIIGACETLTDSLWPTLRDLCLCIRSHIWQDVLCLRSKLSEIQLSDRIGENGELMANNFRLFNNHRFLMKRGEEDIVIIDSSKWFSLFRLSACMLTLCWHLQSIWAISASEHRIKKIGSF